MTQSTPDRRNVVLLADDERDVIEALRLLLKREEYDTAVASFADEILHVLANERIDAVLMDMNFTRGMTSGEEGLHLLDRIRERYATLPIVVMTAWSTVAMAVEAMRRGANDFIEKPWKNERLLSILRTQIEMAQARDRSRRLSAASRLLLEEARGAFVAESSAMQPVLDAVARVAPSDAGVMLSGETGSGKSILAEIIHRSSGRSLEPFVLVNAGSLPDNVLESEMFGHVKGAFTDAKADRMGRFEMADKGTLFLDEIANMPLALQSALLRVIETGEYEPVGSSRTKRADVRIISATNANIEEEVRQGRFRRDLLYRLNTVAIHVPPLRERQEDIPLLAHRFLAQHNARYRKWITGFAGEALTVLRQHPWPGNVRELDHVIERATLMAAGNVIEADDLALSPNREDRTHYEGMRLDEAERRLIERAMERCGGNVNQVAAALGLSRSALYRRLEKHGLSGAE